MTGELNISLIAELVGLAILEPKNLRCNIWRDVLIHALYNAHLRLTGLFIDDNRTLHNFFIFVAERTLEHGILDFTVDDLFALFNRVR